MSRCLRKSERRYVKISIGIDTKREKTKLSTKGKLMKIRRADFLQGEVKAPPSKSITQRAIAISSIDGKSRISNFLDSEDIQYAIEAWEGLGADIKTQNGELVIDGFEGNPNPESKIKVGESGTVLRFILPAVSLSQRKVTVDGKKTLRERSNRTIVDALDQLNVATKGEGSDHRVPIEIKAQGDGDIKGKEVKVSGDESSQVFSALLISLPHSESDTEIVVEDENKLVSRPYIDMTINMLRQANVKINRKGYKWFEVPGGQKSEGLGKFKVSGDYSSAAFLMAAGSLVESKIKITDLKKDGIQGDEEIVNIINQMGGDIKQREDSVEVKGPFDLEGIEIDGRNIPDLVPVISALAAFADGETHISNISHLRHKESDRLKAIAEEFGKLGIKVQKTESDLRIEGSEPEGGKTLDPHEDHRIAMALSLIGLRTGGLKIKNPSCINKSYPDFVNHMKKLGAEISID